jgi:hypothetical protein
MEVAAREGVVDVAEEREDLVLVITERTAEVVVS